MAVNAGGFVAFGPGQVVAFDGFGDFRVTLSAGLIGNLPVAFRDLDRVGIISDGEVEGVPESVFGLGLVFAKKIVRRVAIIARGDAAMARVDPAVILILHDVTIDAGLRIVGEIRRALRINEGVSADPQREAEDRSQHQAGFSGALHLQQCG